MIRHVALFTFKPDVTSKQIEEFAAALRALNRSGARTFTLGRDLGFRPGNMTLGLVADFEHTADWRTYDEDPEHNQIRRGLGAQIVERVERCQFEV
ncbi:MAG: Dabb family protein [Chloroflexi bacterium]|nr:Dabb family protein [Chloroflexota bacterium]